MKQDDKNSPEIGATGEIGLMRHRKITLKDGRYMIFYTFADTLSIEQPRSEPQPDPEMPEKKNV